MKTIDRDGLLLCELQARVFELSVDKAGESSSVFVRRFMNSDAAGWLDSGAALWSNLQPEDLLNLVEEQYGISSYGTRKYTHDEMYWMGYLYRYYSYTYARSSRQAYKSIKPGELRDSYRAYHTLDPAQAIERLLEAKGILEKMDLDRQYEIFKRIREEDLSAGSGSGGMKSAGRNHASGKGGAKAGAKGGSKAGARRRFASAREREAYLLGVFRSRGYFIRKDVEEAIGVSQPAAVLILRKMVEEGQLVKEGAGRTVRYTIPKSL